MSTLKEDITNYLKTHKVIEIINHLSEMVFFFKPENPVDFMAKVIRDMIRALNAGQNVPSLYSEESLRAYFRLLDPAGIGMISWDQLWSAFAVLRLKDVNLPRIREMPVFEDTFVEMAVMCISKRINI